MLLFLFLKYSIQQNSEGLTSYFANIKIIAEYVFSGGLTRKISPINEEISKQILMGLTEIFLIQNNDEGEIIEVDQNHLIAFRDTSSILSGNQQEISCNSDVFIRFGKVELIMNSADFCCIICKQFFCHNPNSTSTQLKSWV